MKGSGDLEDSARTVLGLLGRYPVEAPPRSSAGAAVLVLLREGRSEVETLLIERAVRDDDLASGQVGLPGGHVEESDASLTATALREFEEEVGLSESDLTGPPRFVGYQDAPVFSLRVGVFVAALGPTARAPSARSPKEVAHVFWLPRSALWETRRVSRETVLGSREVDSTLYDGHVLWGFTRRLLIDFFGVEGPARG